MTTKYGQTRDNYATTTAAPRLAGGDSLALAGGAGAALGSLPAGRVWRFTAGTGFRMASEVVLGVFEGTGRSGDTLTGVTAAAGYTDVDLPSGTQIEIRWTAAHADEILAGVGRLERTTFNVLAYGATGDGATDDRAAIQAAIDAASATGHGGAVVLPPGSYLVGAPLAITHACVSLLGTSSGANSIGTVLKSVGSFPVVDIYPAGAIRPDLTFGAALVGAGRSLSLVGSSPQNDATYIDFRDAAAMDIDGLGTFTAECFFRLSGSPQGFYASLLASAGKRTTNDPEASAFWIRTDQNGGLGATLDVGGTAYSLGSSAGVVATGTTYHAALTYDGATIRLFLGAAGGPATMVASHAATGTVAQRPHENGSIGPYRQTWPRGGVLIGTIDGRIDSVRFSSVARYTSAYTAPNAKLAFDGSTLLLENWDNETPEYSIVPTSLGTAYLPKYWVFDGVIMPKVEVGRLEIQSTYGMGIRAAQAITSSFHDLRIFGGAWGLNLWSNCFLSSVDRVDFVGAGPHSRVALAATGANGICEFSRIDGEAYDYGFVATEGSGTLRSSFFHGDATVPIFLRSSSFELQSVNVSNEDVTNPKFEACLMAGGCVTLAARGAYFEATSFARPAVIVDGGDAVTLDTCACEMNAGAAEAIRILADPAARPVRLLNPSFGRVGLPRGVPWSTATVVIL